MSILLKFTADGRIHLNAVKSGQAFTVGWHQTRLGSQITLLGHFTLSKKDGKQKIGEQSRK